MKLFISCITFLLSCPTLISAQSICDTIYDFADQMPQFKKDHNDQFDFVSNELAPIISQCMKRDSSLIASLRTIFTIDKQGNVVNVHFEQPALSTQCRKELTTKILSMKGWTPGSQNGKPVCAQAYWPISCLNWQ